MTVSPLLEIDGLSLKFHLYEGVSHVLDGVSMTIRNGERVALVGESGCGKSVLARAMLGLFARRNVEISGEIRFHGENLLGLSQAGRREFRGRKISMIFQDPMAALNPVFTIADQMCEVIDRGGRAGSRAAARAMAGEALAQVAIDEPDRVLRSYPFQLSGGMAQRVLICMALINRPELVLADEPGTSLDVTVQEQTLRLMTRLTRDAGAAVLLIAHNLGVVREFAERVYVMYAGTIVEEGTVEDLFHDPRHPYTRALFDAVPRLTGGTLPRAIDGMIPDYTRAPEGCRFHPRCPHAEARCHRSPPNVTLGAGRRVRCVLYADERPEMPTHAAPTPRPVAAAHRSTSPSPPAGAWVASSTPMGTPRHPPMAETLIAARGLRKDFRVGDHVVHALRGVDLTLARGECMAVVGESGSGKTTLGNLLLGVERSTTGVIYFQGRELPPKRDRRLRRRLQVVQQNPMSTLNPKRTIFKSVALPLVVHGLVPWRRLKERVAELLEVVGLSPDYMLRYPVALSGGQRQRVALARAIAAQPDCIVLDEPTSSLDVSVQARVLELLVDLQKRFALTYLFITHDLSVVRNISSRVSILYRGRVVESGATKEVFAHPRHRYAQMLLSSVPVVTRAEEAAKPSWPWEREIKGGDRIAEEGCAFHPRCPYALPICQAQRPTLSGEDEGHVVACHNPG